jgi:hypothetical protein
MSETKTYIGTCIVVFSIFYTYLGGVTINEGGGFVGFFKTFIMWATWLLILALMCICIIYSISKTSSTLEIATFIITGVLCVITFVFLNPYEGFIQLVRKYKWITVVSFVILYILFTVSVICARNNVDSDILYYIAIVAAPCVVLGSIKWGFNKNRNIQREVREIWHREIEVQGQEYENRLPIVRLELQNLQEQVHADGVQVRAEFAQAQADFAQEDVKIQVNEGNEGNELAKVERNRVRDEKRTTRKQESENIAQDVLESVELIRKERAKQAEEARVAINAMNESPNKVQSMADEQQAVDNTNKKIKKIEEDEQKRVDDEKAKEVDIMAKEVGVEQRITALATSTRRVRELKIQENKIVELEKEEKTLVERISRNVNGDMIASAAFASFSNENENRKVNKNENENRKNKIRNINDDGELIAATMVSNENENIKNKIRSINEIGNRNDDGELIAASMLSSENIKNKIRSENRNIKNKIINRNDDGELIAASMLSSENENRNIKKQSINEIGNRNDNGELIAASMLSSENENRNIKKQSINEIGNRNDDISIAATMVSNENENENRKNKIRSENENIKNKIRNRIENNKEDSVLIASIVPALSEEQYQQQHVNEQREIKRQAIEQQAIKQQVDEQRAIKQQAIKQKAKNNKYEKLLKNSKNSKKKGYLNQNRIIPNSDRINSMS